MDRFNMFNDEEYHEPDVTYINPRIVNQTYTVMPGDNLTQIAFDYGTTVEELIKLNNLTTTTIFPGQVLTVPYVSEETMEYKVIAGDNLYIISSKLGTTVEQLMELNNLEDTLIFPNQVLLVPYQKEDGMYYKEYITVQGDTIYKIAQNYGIPPKTILMYNDYLKLLLSPNQMIKIPNGMNKYTIKEGDIWKIILDKTGITLEELVEYNQYMWLKPGKSININ